MEPDEKQKRALKDARLLAKLSGLFMLCGSTALILQFNFNSRTSDLNTAQVLGVMTLTATVVLGAWSYINLLNGPRPMPSGFQLLVGYIFGNSIWVLIALIYITPPREIALALLLFSQAVVFATLLTRDKLVGGTVFAGVFIGLLLPILAMGVCAMLV